MNLNGLTTKEVEARIKVGKVNRTPTKPNHSVWKIILRNTLTIFNLVNLILAAMIIIVGSHKNLLFILIAIANTLISIINELRAKRTIDKMKLLSEQQPTVIRDGKTRQIPISQIVEGDLLILGLGDQIIVDARVEEGTVEVNESYVTGEQDSIAKHQGDQLISGSFIVAGTCKATVTAVGAASQLAKIESTAHTIKTADSKLFTLMNNIVKYISFTLIPIGALLLWSRFRVAGTTTETAVTSTVAALINMIPEGLILLTSSVLALATIRLSRKKVLVQDLYSIETLARVDTICLDKTGTITTGHMKVVDFLPADKTGQILTTSNKSPTKTYTSAQNALENAIKLILSTQDADNATSTALKQKLLKTAKFKPTEQILETIPFSSERKYSGVVTSNATYLMGAPEFLGVSELPDFDADYRIIAVTKDKKLLGFALLEDEIRRDAKEIISYFYDNNVAVKIISGDNLTTVQNIAKTVGVKDLAGIDLSTQKSPNYDKLVKEYSIFTRVKPAQKKELIKAFKKQGSTVAMTGDGVNDILAMKEADVSLAIGEGSDAARRSAKMVLLDSDFAGVPSIIAEGRQSINNLERSTTLFLSKTVYASILAVLFTIIPIEYPYAPIEMSLLNFACIGLPGLILALEPNTARIKNQFITNIKKYSIPIGITVSIAMVTLSVVANLNHFTRPELLTASLFTTFAIDLAMIYQISRPLNLLRGSLLASIIVIVASAFLIPYTRNLLDLTIPTLNVTIIVISLISLSLLFSLLLRHFFGSLTHKSPHQTPSPGSRHHS
ncbi:HAD-IC family P-type ATPase [Candidatus Saccharibacteria bacterium]|nr:HAD-IC family P-type ATPase [Candidatus Saccharibacteria bacterium]